MKACISQRLCLDNVDFTPTNHISRHLLTVIYNKSVFSFFNRGSGSGIGNYYVSREYQSH